MSIINRKSRNRDRFIAGNRSIDTEAAIDIHIVTMLIFHFTNMMAKSE
jgi:hypothetical protein